MRQKWIKPATSLNLTSEQKTIHSQ